MEISQSCTKPSIYFCVVFLLLRNCWLGCSSVLLWYIHFLLLVFSCLVFLSFRTFHFVCCLGLAFFIIHSDLTSNSPPWHVIIPWKSLTTKAVIMQYSIHIYDGITSKGYKSDNELHIPHSLDELWSVLCGKLGQNWLCSTVVQSCILLKLPSWIHSHLAHWSLVNVTVIFLYHFQAHFNDCYLKHFQWNFLQWMPQEFHQ